jgi:hypothetical protein
MYVVVRLGSTTEYFVYTVCVIVSRCASTLRTARCGIRGHGHLVRVLNSSVSAIILTTSNHQPAEVRQRQV